MENIDIKFSAHDCFRYVQRYEFRNARDFNIPTARRN